MTSRVTDRICQEVGICREMSRARVSIKDFPWRQNSIPTMNVLPPPLFLPLPPFFLFLFFLFFFLFFLRLNVKKKKKPLKLKLHLSCCREITIRKIRLYTHRIFYCDNIIETRRVRNYISTARDSHDCCALLSRGY